MNTERKNIVSLSEAIKDFSQIARMADENGEIYIYENDRPKYKLISVEHDTSIEMTDDEKIDFVAARVLREYRAAFEELAKTDTAIGEAEKEFEQDGVLLDARETLPELRRKHFG